MKRPEVVVVPECVGQRYVTLHDGEWVEYVGHHPDDGRMVVVASMPGGNPESVTVDLFIRVPFWELMPVDADGELLNAPVEHSMFACDVFFQVQRWLDEDHVNGCECERIGVTDGCPWEPGPSLWPAWLARNA